MDAAIHLCCLGSMVTVIERNRSLYQERHSDPSLCLSPITLDRQRESRGMGRIRSAGGVGALAEQRGNGEFEVMAGRKPYSTPNPPLLATGFAPCADPVAHLLEWTADGCPVLTGRDEPTLAPGLFLAGSVVRHDGAIFCFISKFRYRFAVIAHAIPRPLGHSTEEPEVYRRQGMFLHDLSCCGEEGAC